MATATLKWTLPATRVDGSPLAAADITLIDVLDNGAVIATLPGQPQDYTTDTLTVGDHAFTVVVQDSGGRRSDASNVAAVNVPEVAPPPPPETANPSPVADLSATLNP